jgi:hypothetical protein
MSISFFFIEEIIRRTFDVLIDNVGSSMDQNLFVVEYFVNVVDSDDDDDDDEVHLYDHHNET